MTTKDSNLVARVESGFISTTFPVDLSLAHAAWNDHIQRKRSGKATKRPVADVMIGALAQANDGLITRNADDFRALSPSLCIITP